MGSFNLNRLPAMALSVALGGCAVVSSSGHLTAPPNSIRRSEAVYSLPRTIFNVKASLASGTVEANLSVSKITEADPRARLRFHYEPSPLSDDHLTADLSPNGLLNAITSEVTDKTGDIAVNLAQMVFSLGTGGGQLPDAALRSLPDKAVAAKSFAASYDPLDPADIAATRPQLAQMGFCILVGEEAVRDGVELGPAACPVGGHASVVLPPPWVSPSQFLVHEPGIYYRQPVPTPVRIYQRKKNWTWEPIWAGNEHLFDQRETYQVTITRAAFAQRKMDLAFQDGALTKVKIDKGSELLGLSTIGLKIVRVVVAIPLEALNQRKKLIDAQAELLKAETNRLTQLNELAKLQVQTAGATTRSLVRTDVAFEPAVRSLGGGSSLATSAVPPGQISICQTNIGVSVEQCRSFVTRSANGL